MNPQLQQATLIQSKLRTVFPLAGSGRGGDTAERIEFLQRLYDAKIVHELERSFEDPLAVVVAGGTNVGKTEVFNSLCGEVISQPDPRAGRTRRPAVFADTTRLDTIQRPGFLQGYDRTALADSSDLERPMAGPPSFHYTLRDNHSHPGLIIVDSPDIDSNRLDNVAVAQQLLAASDVIVFVTSPSKYNDEACVSFLDQALILGKLVFVVFNLLGPESEKVIDDFRSSVLGRQNRTSGLDITAVPRFPKGTEVFPQLAEHTHRLLGKLSELPRPETKRQLAVNTLAYVRTEYGEVIDIVKKDIERIERLARTAEAEIADVRSGYQSNLAREPFYEIEAVFQEVLEHFSVPIVDDVLKAPGKAVKWIVQKIQGRDSERDESENKIRRRKEKDRQRLAEMADALRSRTFKNLVNGASDPVVAGLMERAEQGPLSRPAEPAAEKIWEELEPSFQRWKDEMRLEIIDKIQASPNLKALLKTGKAVLQIGSGVLAAVLIGGIGTTDLVIGPLAAKFMQYILETFGSSYFSDKREGYLELHLHRFDEITNRIVLEPLQETFPARPDLDEMEAAKQALDDFNFA